MNRLTKKKSACVNSWNPGGEPVIHTKTDCSDFPEAKRLLELGADPRSQSTEPSQKGYTLLHIACLKANIELVELLITTYKVDASAVAADGFQPIHFAVFNSSLSIIKILLGAFVSTETKITKAMFEQYYARGSNCSQKHERIWRDDFGNSITLLTYAVLCNNLELVKILLDRCAELMFEDHENETLLMKAVYFHFTDVIKCLLEKMHQRDINITNNRGFTALHYLFKQSSDVRDEIDFEILELLVNRGADIDALIHGDPATLVLNMAAYLCQYKVLQFLLPRQRFSSIVRPLYYANLPISENYPSKYISFEKFNFSYCNDYPGALEIIVKHTKLRIFLGWPVLPEEIQIMNNTKLTCPIEDDFALLVDYLKNRIKIMFRGKQTPVFEILSKEIKELREAANNREFLRVLNKFHDESQRKCKDSAVTIAIMIKVRMEQALRLVLLDKFKKLAFFSETMFYYIPFDSTFEIAKYLNVHDLKNFIDTYGP